MSELLSILLSLPTMGIYAFINESDRKVYIGHSRNLVTGLSRIIEEIKSSNKIPKKDFPKLKFMLLEEVLEYSNLKPRYQFWTKEYSRLGYVHYRVYNAVQYRLKVDIFTDHGERALCQVKLVSRGRRELTVGIFRTIEESDAFVNKYYSDSSNIFNIHYADNDLTREFIS